jgi:histidyl-tRNA synthetase
LNIPQEKIDIYVVALDKELSAQIFELVMNFRNNNLSSEFDYFNRSVKAQMREANKLSAGYVLFVGGDEFKNGKLNLKNMETGEQQLIEIRDFHKILDIVGKGIH